MSRRGKLGAAVLAAVVAIGVATYALASGDSSDFEPPVVDPSPKPAPAAATLVPEGTEVLVRGVDSRATRADGPIAYIDDRGRAREGRLSCKRVAGIDGSGLCLRVAENGNSYEGVTFGADGQILRRFPVDGIPDRSRLSDDGRYATYTSFDPAGARGYFETPTAFSTFTRILDMRSGRVLLKLEDLRITDDGKPIVDDESELWGVTFGRGGEYYATLAAKGEHYLIRGRVGSRRAQVVRDHVECPALSPDGSRIAYKRRIGDTNEWRYHVLDIESAADVALAEPKSVDDQPEWLSDELVMYSDDKAVFAVPADGSGAPRLLARDATSPIAISR